MPQNKPHIGGEEVKQDSGAIPIEGLPSNKTLYVAKLNNEGPDVTPRKCKNLKEVFKGYNPTQEVSITNREGGEETIELKFNAMEDFNPKNVMVQSETITRANNEKEVLDDLAKQLNKNTALKKLLADPAKKKLFLELMEKNLELLGGSVEE
ncbi:MAG: type VI secretion system contractile sheath small subunit [Candidatus Zixiibacteriota bacterium]|nr:MAG: type VI secretion system contractile sheath small subunit [candidate division Zixibacteria bacterium]